MYLDLRLHHAQYLLPIINARIKLIRNRIIKEYGSDWGDYDADGLETKINEKSDEYFRLKQIVKQFT